MSKIQELKNISHENVRSFLHKVITTASFEKVSDIHFIPQSEKKIKLKFRLDSVMCDITVITSKIYEQLISHIKVLANLDITIHYSPQDGCFTLKHSGRDISCRINICPTINGPRAVIRIINEIKELPIENLGFDIEQARIVKKHLKKKQGLILIVGPTGCGKTVTMYNLLAHLRKNNLNILTVCDPVEIYLDGISQTSVENQINLNYPTVLKAFLRQDPDIIMIGEIRDRSTLKIAMQAATTGHFVLSSIHTENTKTSLARLSSLGGDKNEIKDNISLIIAQRLIRKICNICYRKMNCCHCSDGYKGVVAIYEILELEKLDSSRNWQQQFSPKPKLRDIADRLIAKKITDIEEIKRVFG
ncbi:MAG: GspE/PulE family protein [Pseudomonadota bacterium]|nr:GspE/PulE family protein [Pseudomonadota bacterium]